VGKTLLVHSRLTGEAKEKALADLESVEDLDSPVRIVISVGMLKEGWDVKSVYVIASMRASVSEVMTEQTLGRGMRLPFGKYTKIELLDTLEVLAHEKYSELLEKRKVLNEAFIDYGTYAEVRQLADGSAVVRQAIVGADAEVFGPPGQDAATPAVRAPLVGSQVNGEQAGGQVAEHQDSRVGPVVGESRAMGVVDVETRTRQAQEAAESTAAVIRYDPLPSREPILIPCLISVPQPVAVSLNAIVDYSPFERLGQALATDLSDEYRRTKLVAEHDGRRVHVSTETAVDKIASVLPFDIPLSQSKESLVARIMAVKGVPSRALELGAAQRIVEHLVEAMGDTAAEHLSAFGERCGQRLAIEVAKALRDANSAQVTYSDEVQLVALEKTREARKRQATGHADGQFDKAIAFNGWNKNLYSHAWFDTSLEYKAANAIDSGTSVVVWARLHINDVPITWTSEGRRYNPDFVIIEEDNGTRRGWLMETKADRDMPSAEVLAKKRAAQRWANTANSSPEIQVTWKYLLVSEQDVEDAQGSWEQLKRFGQ